LGGNAIERQENYRNLFKLHVSEKLVTELRQATNAGLALGGENFVRQIEDLSGQRVGRRRVGRPKANIRS